MLKVKEEERLNWEEIFNDPLIKNSQPVVVKEVNQGNEKDNLEQSVNLNDQYLTKNLVVGYLVNNPHQAKKPEDAKTNPSNKEGEVILLGNSVSMADIITKQKENEQARKNIQKINEYILYERNIAFFSNLVIQKLIKSYNNKKVQVIQDLYFRIIFSICKYQNMQLDKMNDFLNQAKTEGFSETIWQKYKESTEFQTTQQLIKADISHSKEFFEELFKKTKEVITYAIGKETNQEKKEKLNKFLSFIDKTFSLDSKFKNIFKSTLHEMIDYLKQLIISSPKPSKDILIITRYLLVCNNPYLEFNNSSFDFNKFYEDIEQLPEEDIKKEVLEKMNKLK